MALQIVKIVRSDELKTKVFQAELEITLSNNSIINIKTETFTKRFEDAGIKVDGLLIPGQMLSGVSYSTDETAERHFITVTLTVDGNDVNILVWNHNNEEEYPCTVVISCDKYSAHPVSWDAIDFPG